MAGHCGNELSSGAVRSFRNEPPSTFSLRIPNFSLLMQSEAVQKKKSSTIKKYESKDFEAGGYTWKMILYPNGEDGREDYISLYLQIQKTAFMGTDWEVKVDMKLCVVNASDNKFLMVRDLDVKHFNVTRTQSGFGHFLSHKIFNDPANGYLVKDSCVFGAEIFVIKSTEMFETPTCVKDPETGNITCTIESSPILDAMRPSNPSEEPGNKGTPAPETGISPSNISEIQRIFRVAKPAHCIFPVDSFSQLCNEGKKFQESTVFDAGGFRWKLILCLNCGDEGNKAKHISLYLRIVKTEYFPKSWEVHAFFRFFILNQDNDKFLMIQEPLGNEIKRFHELKKEYGIVDLLSFEEFTDPSKGYLKEDKCYFGAEVTVVSPTKGFMPVELTSNGTYLWTIENFSNVRNIEGCIHSRPYSLGGTQWKLTVYPKEIGIYLSLQDSLNVSENKKWTVKFTLSLLNMKTGHHFNRTMDYNFVYASTEWGCMHFISVNDLTEAKGFVAKGDKVHVQVKFDSVTVEDRVIKKVI